MTLNLNILLSIPLFFAGRVQFFGVGLSYGPIWIDTFCRFKEFPSLSFWYMHTVIHHNRRLAYAYSFSKIDIGFYVCKV